MATKFPILALAAIAALAATPPAAAQTAYVSRSGRLLIFHAGSPVVAVPGAPSCLRGGAPVDLPPPIWDQAKHHQPWIAYRLPGPPVAPGEVLSFTAPAGWLKAAAPLPAPTGAVANHAGVLEPGFTGPATMKLGMNIIGPVATTWMPYFTQANLVRRLRADGWGYGVAVGPDGMPTTLFGGVASQVLWSTLDNGIDAAKYPGPTGYYTVVWDDTAPDAPSSVSITSWNPDVVVTPTASLPGNAQGGKLVGRTNQFKVAYRTAAPASVDLALRVRIARPAGPSTVQGLAIAGPGDGPNRADPLAPSIALRKWLNLASPKGPGPLRYMATTGTVDSTVVDADRVHASQFTWGGMVPPAPVGIASVGPVASPAAYAFAAYGAPDHAPYLVAPAPGVAAPVGPFRLAFTAGWPNQKGWSAAEATTTAPHGLRTGNQARLNGVPGLENYGVDAFVTGPTSFAFPYWGTPRGLVSFAPGKAKATLMPANRTAIPHAAAAIVSARSGGEHWCNIPTMADDDCVRAIAAEVMANFPAGRKVYVEPGNEEWNWGYVGTMFRAATGDLLTPKQWYIGNGVARSAQVVRIFRDAFAAAGRAADLVAVYGAFLSDSTGTRAAVQSQAFDAVAVSPYYNAPAFLVGPAKGLADGSWAMNEYLDLYRHCIRFDTDVAAVLGRHRAELAKSHASPPPRLITYEGGPQVVVAYAAAATRPAATALAHDAVYHPDMYDVERAHYLSLQEGGVSLHVPLGLCYPWTAQGSGPTVWGMTTWQGQPAGRGKANKAAFPALKAHDLENQSVRLQAWADWAKEAN